MSMNCRIVSRSLALALIVVFLPACSVKHIAVNKLGNALASGGSTFTSDEDPELVRDALPSVLS